MVCTVRRKTAKVQRERSKLEMTVAVLWRTNEDDATMNGERLKGVRQDGQGLAGKAGDGRTCSGTEESVHST